MSVETDNKEWSENYGLVVKLEIAYCLAAFVLMHLATSLQYI